MEVNVDSSAGNEFKLSKEAYILSGILSVSGLVYAFYKKKTFWAYVGYFILGSLVGSTAGQVINKLKS